MPHFPQTLIILYYCLTIPAADCSFIFTKQSCILPVAMETSAKRINLYVLSSDQFGRERWCNFMYYFPCRWRNLKSLSLTVSECSWVQAVVTDVCTLCTPRCARYVHWGVYRYLCTIRTNFCLRNTKKDSWNKLCVDMPFLFSWLHLTSFNLTVMTWVLFVFLLVCISN